MLLFPRITCTAPHVFYRCQSNGFSGCCLVDPCALPDCPSDANTDNTSSNGPSNTAASTHASASPTTGTIPGTGQTSGTVVISSLVVISTSGAGTTPAATSTLLTSTPLNGFLSAVGSAAQAISSATAHETSSSLPLSLDSTRTSSSSTAAVATPSTISPTGAPDSPLPVSKASTIGGVVGGVGGVLLVGLSLWLFWIYRRKRTRYEKAQTHDKGSSLQGNGPGGTQVSHRDHDSEKSGQSRFWAKTRKPRGSAVSSVGSWEENGTPSPVSPMHLVPGGSPISYHGTPPIQLRGSEQIAPPLIGHIEGSGPNIVPELSGITVENHIAELSPDPERSAINARDRGPTTGFIPIASKPETLSAAGPLPSLDKPVMHSTLNSPFCTNFSSNYMNRRARDGTAPHATSWMDYEQGVGNASVQPKQ